MTSGIAWLVAQAQAAAATPPPPERFNPRPLGVIRDGSTTQLVLVFLQARPHQLFPHWQIVSAVGRSKVAVDWALAFLRQQGLVDAIPDRGRNARYFRYRIKRDAKHG